mmetsp:Transcript_63871/g.197749  ORF Transcript_63871/g.197749 Transcript_63871/m.197749 type:complete len:211 (-) Transcript_63871:151-783(-)
MAAVKPPLWAMEKCDPSTSPNLQGPIWRYRSPMEMPFGGPGFRSQVVLPWLAGRGPGNDSPSLVQTKEDLKGCFAMERCLSPTLLIRKPPTSTKLSPTRMPGQSWALDAGVELLFSIGAGAGWSSPDSGAAVMRHPVVGLLQVPKSLSVRIPRPGRNLPSKRKTKDAFPSLWEIAKYELLWAPTRQSPICTNLSPKCTPAAFPAGRVHVV